MTDRHTKHSFADDPEFLTRLNELDRGMRGDHDEPVEVAPRRRVSPPRTPGTHAESVPAPQAVARRAHDPDDEKDRVASGPDPARHPGRRPLLERSPVAPVLGERPPGPIGGERPPGPLIGTAIGPRLPRIRAPRGAPSASAGADPLTYETFYGIAQKPFGISPDPKFFYHSAAHERVMHELGAAVRERQGVAVLVGELGVGKTTVCSAFIGDLDRRTVTSLVPEPFVTVDELLKTVLEDFGVVSRDDLASAPEVTSEVLIATLRLFLESLAPLQANAVIVVDDAHDLPLQVFQELLAVVDAGGETGLQVVLVGQPALGAILRGPELRPLADRIVARSELGPLAADEMLGYVTHRLTVAGSSGRVDFSDVALARLYELSRGVPRVVNLLCDRALSRGHQTSASVIDRSLVGAAAGDLGLGAAPAETRGVFVGLLTAFALVALMLAGAAAALWIFRDAAGRTIEQWGGVPAPPGQPILRLPAPLAPILPPDDPAATTIPPAPRV